MSSKFTSTKVISLGSTAFRQPYATSHCRFLHGYRLQAKFWFTCNTLDNNNWVVDFGALKDLKSKLEETFDHTTVIFAKDPQRPLFELLHEKGVIDLRVMQDGVGIEKFAQFCYNVANSFIKNLTNNRCWVQKVEVWEHESNSATYEEEADVLSFESSTVNTLSQIIQTTVDATQPPPPTLVAEVKPTIPTPEVTSQQPTNIPPLNNKSSGMYKDLFKGTKWGVK